MLIVIHDAMFFVMTDRMTEIGRLQFVRKYPTPNSGLWQEIIAGRYTDLLSVRGKSVTLQLP